MVSNVTKLGYDPVTALGGEEALKLADQHLPHAFVVDVNMPEMNGLQVLEALRDDTRFKEAPIIMLTSVTDEDVVRRSIEGKGNRSRPCVTGVWRDLVVLWIYARVDADCGKSEGACRWCRVA